MPSGAVRARWSLLLGTLLWTAAIAAGLVGLWRYDFKRGAAAAVPDYAAFADEAGRAGDQAHLVMLAHPRCPCTRASIAELARLMAQAPGRLVADVYFVQPPGTADDFVETDLWQSAAAIPGVRVWRDRDGRAAARFGAETSGQVVLFDAAGRRRFQGGITAARGHEGDNAGRAAVLAALDGDAPADTPVFGCGLGNAPSGSEERPCPM
ncbi:MAG: RedB protein [Deltaproteobacteria bacterium]|nr:RedB protein [Deltaproteobacteria bacterium]